MTCFIACGGGQCESINPCYEWLAARSLAHASGYDYRSSLTLRVMKEAGLLTDQVLRRPAASAVGLLTLRVMKEAGLLTDQTLRRPAASAVGLLTLRVMIAPL